MKKIVIEPTANTPGVYFDDDKSCISIEGRSIPENPAEFYEALANWTSEKLVVPYPEVQLDFRLEYVNSASAKQILNFMRIVREKIYDGCKCRLRWFYEDDDESILELGEHLKNTLGIPIELVESGYSQ